MSQTESVDDKRIRQFNKEQRQRTYALKSLFIEKQGFYQLLTTRSKAQEKQNNTKPSHAKAVHKGVQQSLKLPKSPLETSPKESNNRKQIGKKSHHTCPENQLENENAKQRKSRKAKKLVQNPILDSPSARALQLIMPDITGKQPENHVQQRNHRCSGSIVLQPQTTDENLSNILPNLLHELRTRHATIRVTLNVPLLKGTIMQVTRNDRYIDLEFSNQSPDAKELLAKQQSELSVVLKNKGYVLRSFTSVI